MKTAKEIINGLPLNMNDVARLAAEAAEELGERSQGLGRVEMLCLLRRVEGIAQRPLRAMSTKECRELLEQAFGSSNHSFNNGRTILHSIFAYGLRREW